MSEQGVPGQSARSAGVKNFDENFNHEPLRRSAFPLADCLHLDVHSRNMKPLRDLVLLIAITLCWSAVAMAEPQEDGESDPFASDAEAVPKLREGEFFTAAGLTVRPIEGWNPQRVGADDLPDVVQPTQFNRSFERPTAVWRVGGGFAHHMRYGWRSGWRAQWGSVHVRPVPWRHKGRGRRGPR